MENSTKLLIKSPNDMYKHSQQLLRIYEVHNHSLSTKEEKMWWGRIHYPSCSVLEQLGAHMCDIFQTVCQIRKDIRQITDNDLSIVIQQPCGTPVYSKALCMNSSKAPFTHTIRTPHFHISKFPFLIVFAICTTCSCSFGKALKHFHKHWNDSIQPGLLS